MSKELVEEKEKIKDDIENNETEILEGKNKVLSIEDILEKKDACKERRKQKFCYVYSKFLKGNLEAHSISRKDFNDIMSFETDKRNRAFIFRSIDKLRDSTLLKGFGRSKDSDKIVEDIFSPIERASIIDILLELNGLIGLDDNAIMKVEIEELQGE